MPNLLEGSAPLKIDFAVSLSHSLLATMGLVCAAPDFEGLADWLHETRASMAADLRDELCRLVSFPGGYQRFTSELVGRLPKGAAGLDFEGLMAHLRAIPDVHYQLLALRALGRGATPRPEPISLLALTEEPADWAAYLSQVGSSVAPEVVASLLRDAEGLKRRILAVLERFWREIYAAEFEATRSMMDRSVVHHRAQNHSSLFLDLFTAVTGRLAPEGIIDLLPAVSAITFIPSCYVGPYVAYTHSAEDLIIFYNCRSTPASPAEFDGASLYPPLKALADETRLQILALLRGRELYAQEIVEQVGISQPAVSRHLNLMVAAGVLQVRREGNTKYYAIAGHTLAELADALRAFV